MVVCGVLDVLCCVGRRLDETTCNRERDAWIALHKKVSLSLWFSLCLSVSLSLSLSLSPGSPSIKRFASSTPLLSCSTSTD